MIAAGTAFSFVSSLKVMSKSCDLKILINKIVLINTANVNGPNWRTGRWIAYLFLDSGVTISTSGGTTETGSGEGTPGVINNPPIYYSNGNFKLI